jgi:hypothetical protein
LGKINHTPKNGEKAQSSLLTSIKNSKKYMKYWPVFIGNSGSSTGTCSCVQINWRGSQFSSLQRSGA